MTEIGELKLRLATCGLLLRGGFCPAPNDDVPLLSDARPAATLLLIGNAGPEMWTHFVAGTERSLDAWTRRVVSVIARDVGAEALFPFDGPPHLPFQRWALRADDVHVSPLKLLIHPEFGLWHAYRAALAFAQRLALPARSSRESPCERCADRPCLTTCPVRAFSVAHYDVAACVAHIRSVAGADCRDEGCRARGACPVGRAYRYVPAQAQFHMQAFSASPTADAALADRAGPPSGSPGRGRSW